jgi:D-alanyl-D-alanine carboxypeptidase
MPAPAQTGRASAPSSAPASHHGWVVQIGATDSVDQAQTLLAKAQHTVLGVTASAEPFTEPVQSGKATLYRARFAGFGDRQTAQLACAALKRQDMACFTARD